MSARKKKQARSTQKLKDIAAGSYLAPSHAAANAIQDLTRDVEIQIENGGMRGLDFSALVTELEKRNRAVVQGDLGRVETMLLDQAHVLQSLFVFFTQKMAHSEYIEQLETYSRIALKTQNQCRQTLATLGELKNPKRATFIKQQNNAVNQQINQQSENPKNLEDPANKILEEIPNERLDYRTPQASIGVNQAVEAVGKSDRTKNEKGEKEG